MPAKFTVSVAFIPASTGWQTRNNVSREEARELVKAAIAKGVSQIIVYEYWVVPQTNETEDLWQFVYHTGMFKGWDCFHIPTMTYYEKDLSTKKKHQPYLDTCEHGMSAWLCEGPQHYPIDM